MQRLEVSGALGVKRLRDVWVEE